jgi:hypothetical protein
MPAIASSKAAGVDSDSATQPSTAETGAPAEKVAWSTTPSGKRTRTIALR